MDGVQWLILVVVVVVAVIAYRRSVQTRERRDQSRQMTAHARGPARSPTEEISQREDRRLAGMTEDDRAWEANFLRHQRGSQERTPDG